MWVSVVPNLFPAYTFWPFKLDEPSTGYEESDPLPLRPFFVNIVEDFLGFIQVSFPGPFYDDPPD